jgi:CPA1 family monovalent cation:H+ antiporter
VFLDGVLALLLFAGSLHVDMGGLRVSIRLIAVLSTVSVILATVLFAAGLWLVFQAVGTPVPLAWCGVAGAILAPTDAVVADAILRRVGLPRRLRGVILGESLFNDGAGVVLFLITLGIVHGETGMIGHGRVAAALLIAGLGGAAIGWVGGYIAARLIRRITDDGLRLTVTLALVMATYRIALTLEVSGPIAVVVSGLVVAAMLPRLGGTDESPSVIVGFWALLDELLNAMLFVLIGFQISEISLDRIALVPILLAVPLAVVSRMISIAPPILASAGPWRVRLRRAVVLTWTGMRGGISVALALTLPQSPYRAELLAVCYVVVVFSIIVQGLTMPRVLGALLRPQQAQPG